MNQKGYGFIGGIINLVFGIIISIVAVRFVFQLVGANADNGIVNWIYQASAPLVAPFSGILGGVANIGNGRLEFDTLVALLIYGVIAALAGALFGRSYRRSHAA